ncbi:hypothetical protein RF683_02190 [Flavobacterium sp. 20NA77.7]|uniref:Nuclear transport factor 2 family protein n=1 Tax=Flavobacterium nakdongensis TaxID=3073563 RepID=A0ABY9RAJ9_9FLAO|nr:hypothetical protein [Flavobacterium sp. 20NA77.7]WMW78275.1 hypothetical protein RF683_02190 [Flavobacterium sp. 20NA77.7]
MKTTVLLILFLVSSLHAQKSNEIKYYNYGKNGIEFIVKEAGGATIIISTFNARPSIKDEVALGVLRYFDEKHPKNGEKIKIETKEAIVEGTFNVIYKENLISIEFHYETVIWFKKGLKEVYDNPEGFNIKNILVEN